MGYYHLLDPQVKKRIEDILESQYQYISDEKSRREKIKHDLESSEAEVLSKIPVTLRQRIINMRNDKNLKYDAKWVSQTEAQSIMKTVSTDTVPLQVEPVELQVSDLSVKDNAIKSYTRNYGK